MTLPEDSVDIYIGIESVKSAEPPASWWPDYPAELPFYELWLESGDDRPKVRDPGDIKTGNRKPENAKAYVDEQLEKDREAQRQWDLHSRDRYQELLNAQQLVLDDLHDASALDGFLGGQVACIGVAVGEEGKARVIEPDSDPLMPPDPTPAVGPKLEAVQQRLWLYTHREYRMIKRLSKGIQAAATRGMPEGRQRRVRLVAWNGFRFDFQMLALRCAALARLDSAHADGEPAGLRDDLSADGYDRDLTYLAGLCWHGVPWRSTNLYDPRVPWAFGDSPRFVRGRLPNVAKFFGWHVTPNDEALLAIDYDTLPSLLAGDPKQRALAYKVCALGVRMLKFVHGRMLDLGVA